MPAATLVSSSLDRLRRVRPHLWDIALVFLALAFCAVILLYPFGRDQGLYHYMGREWFRGSVPYRDTMEQKTPLIFFLFGLAKLLFGEHFYSFRILEWLWVPTVGWVVGTLATPRGETPVAGIRGATALVGALVYVGIFTFWDTAQCEVWTVGLSLCALCCIERRGPDRRYSYWGGVLGGLAITAKPTALLLVAVVGLAAIERAFRAADVTGPRLRRALESAGLFTAGVLTPLAMLFVYFGAHHALADVYDVLVRANAYYLESEANVRNAEEARATIGNWMVDRYPLTTIPTLVPVIGLVAGLAARSWERTRRYVITIALLLLTIAGIAVQRKYYVYHWGAFLILFTLPFAYALDDVARGCVRAFDNPRIAGRIAGAFALVVFVLYSSIGNGPRYYKTALEASIKYMRGQITHEAYLDQVNIPGYDVHAIYVIGRWLEEHTQPSDYVAMRNFETPIYLAAHRRAPTRFFWTPWLAWNSRAYRRREWLAQDAEMMRRNPPKYIVTVGRFHEGAESPEYYRPAYEDRFRFGEFVVMEHVAPLAAH